MITVATQRAMLREVEQVTDLNHLDLKIYMLAQRLSEVARVRVLGNPQAAERGAEHADDIERLSKVLLACARKMKKLIGGRRG
jgi:hypothetical protein